MIKKIQTNILFIQPTNEKLIKSCFFTSLLSYIILFIICSYTKNYGLIKIGNFITAICTAIIAYSLVMSTYEDKALITEVSFYPEKMVVKHSYKTEWLGKRIAQTTIPYIKLTEANIIGYPDRSVELMFKSKSKNIVTEIYKEGIISGRPKLDYKKECDYIVFRLRDEDNVELVNTLSGMLPIELKRVLHGFTLPEEAKDDGWFIIFV